MKKVLFIGAGNMGQAIMSGLIENKIITHQNIDIYEINKKIIKKINDQYQIKAIDHPDSISEYKVIFLAVKPYHFYDFKNHPDLKKIRDRVNSQQLVISVMAGVTIKEIEDFFIHEPAIIRAMPNTPALIGEAMTVISPGAKTNEKDLSLARQIFSSIGEVEMIAEEYLDAVTGLSGSGPAYVYLFLESLIQGGVLCGLSRDFSQKLAIQTMLGSLKMIDDEHSSDSIERLRHLVTTPGGTTIEALTVLEESGIRGVIARAVKKAADKSKGIF